MQPPVSKETAAAGDRPEAPVEEGDDDVISEGDEPSVATTHSEEI
jgi:hypothetical protein